MDKHTATEQAYKRGYEDGKQDAMKPIENDKVMERLTEILRNGILAAMDDDNRYLYTDVVDYMMAHGVTVATDNNVGDKTNADRIRAWNDHELAETIANFVSEIDNGDVRYSDDPNDWLKWLQQPVED